VRTSSRASLETCWKCGGGSFHHSDEVLASGKAPGLQSYDLSVVKDFPIRERFDLRRALMASRRQF